MKWQILILTKPERHEFLDQLMSCLEPQVANLGLKKSGEIDILIHKDDWIEPPFLGVGGKREIARQKATGDYINWFDDDDLPSPDYVSSIYPVLDGTVDYIGFNLHTTINKRYIGPTIHSLKCGGWTDNYRDPRHLRDISHLNPMRRELAMQKSFSGPIGEDHRWANDMHYLVKTEHYIDKVLYYYLAREGKNDAVDARDPWRLEWLERLRP